MPRTWPNRACAQAGRRLLPGDADPSLGEALRRIADNAGRAGAIITQMRAFFRKDESPRCAVDLNAVVREVLSLCAREALQLGVRIEIALAPDLPEVDATPIQLQQVVLNLLRNALEALSGVPATTRGILIQTREHGNAEVALNIRDNGPGLPAECPEEVLEPFVSHRAGGMGLGLSISRSIVEAHGGRLRPRNTSEGGAEFLVTLPARIGDKA